MQQLKYCVIVINLELLIDDLWFRELLKLTKFISKLFNATFDKGYCISQLERSIGGQIAPISRYQLGIRYNHIIV